MASDFEDKVLRTLDLLDRNREHGVYRNQDVDTRLERLNERINDASAYTDKRCRIAEEQMHRAGEALSMIKAELDALKAGLYGNR